MFLGSIRLQRRARSVKRVTSYEGEPYVY